jgi:hypothetical protein
MCFPVHAAAHGKGAGILSERNVMGGPGVCRRPGPRPDYAGIGEGRGPDGNAVAKRWKEGGDAGDGRSQRAGGSGRSGDAVKRKATPPGITKKAAGFLLGVFGQ